MATMSLQHQIQPNLFVRQAIRTTLQSGSDVSVVFLREAVTLLLGELEQQDDEQRKADEELKKETKLGEDSNALCLQAFKRVNETHMQQVKNFETKIQRQKEINRDLVYRLQIANLQVRLLEAQLNRYQTGVAVEAQFSAGNVSMPN